LNKLTSLIFAPKEPYIYIANPCTEIYEELGFTGKAHAKTLELLQETDPDYLKATLERLSLVNHSLAKELNTLLGFKGEGLKKSFKSSKDIENEYI